MKKVNDERLKIKQLKNIKLAFIFENSLILLYLIIQAWQSQQVFKQVLTWNNPLWVVFILTMAILGILEQNVTAAIDDHPKLSTKKLLIFLSGQFLIYSFLWAWLFNFQRLWLALICGGGVALVVTGVLAYNNVYRSKQ
ncbi:hypothetical protein [Liquorilactobacillus sicerae]|uniref:hypothetical protein n=1 Tax=Liquorilactobacillus sicerae TaxID=1416943 RepID=UPI0024810183|nr:hypothetical protein [Liquorilactobacillus sicerae]